jgi:hypothetical protein
MAVICLDWMKEGAMRTIGHFIIFIGFFLVFSCLLALLLLGALALESTLVLLMVLPALPGLYMLYVRSYRALLGRPPQDQKRSLG